MTYDFVQRTIDAGSKHTPEELEAAWKRMKEGAIQYLRAADAQNKSLQQAERPATE